MDKNMPQLLLRQRTDTTKHHTCHMSAIVLTVRHAARPVVLKQKGEGGGGQLKHSMMIGAVAATLPSVWPKSRTSSKHATVDIHTLYSVKSFAVLTGRISAFLPLLQYRKREQEYAIMVNIAGDRVCYLGVSTRTRTK